MTNDICDRCWGSGDDKKPWMNLMWLNRVMTSEQVEAYQECRKEKEDRDE